MDKKVSVIIPAYNVELFISECLTSVIGQTYQNLEIIVIDDGSTDNTLEKIRYFADLDSRVVVVSQKNQGVSAARNKGLSLAGGEYVTFIDSDDTYNPDSIEIMVQALEEKNTDCVNVQYILREKDDANKRNNVVSTFPVKFYMFETKEEKIDFLVKELSPYYVGYEVWDKLYRLDIIKRNEISFDEKNIIGEDLGFNIKFFSYANSVYCIDTCCYNYRVRPESAMNSANDVYRGLEEKYIMLDGIKKFYNERNMLYMSQQFYRIFCAVLDNTFKGNKMESLLEVIRKSKFCDFQYRESCIIVRNKKIIRRDYDDELGNMRWRVHLYIKTELGKATYMELLYLKIYELYRRCRGRDSLKNWVIR